VGYRARVKRFVGLVVAAYVAAAVVGLALERAGLRQCGCRAKCWCKRPGLSVFRWVFPFRHDAVDPEAKRLLNERER
jgi:hypothetical protein